MPRIKVLDPQVAELIAAGEVVERPASIAKELIENSVDAGATQVTVEIRGGGIGYLRVTDNGVGIAAEDVPIAFQRHATSKVRSAFDLEAIGTLGFRGEALASIAAVSKVEITTKTKGATDGTTFQIQGEDVFGPHPAGAPDGTTLIIRDIFHNTPARMKFLRRDITEGNAVAQVVDQCALSYPEIAFTFIRDSGVKLRTSGNGDLRAVVAAVYDRSFAADMIEVDYVFEDSIHVSGLICHPSSTKPSRTYQHFFINNRYVRTRTCGAAVEQAYKGKIMTGRFPTCVLNVSLDLSHVDPNVHPAKIEVRFTHEKPVFSAVYYAVKSGLSTLDAPLEVPPEKKTTPLTLNLPVEPPEQQRIDQPRETQKIARSHATTGDVIKPSNFHEKLSLSSGTKSAFTIPTIASEKHAEENMLKTKELSSKIIEKKTDTVSDITPINLRQIGELFQTYILLEQGEELLLVDKHAAHERILYEKIRENQRESSGRQVLLQPVPVTLQRQEYDALLEHQETVKGLGFFIEDFGTGTLIVRETPIALDGEDVTYLLSELADNLLSQRSDLTPEALETLYDSIACKTALRAGDDNNPAELGEIVRLLVQNPHITHCPHGRPIVLRVSQKEIEKMFGRLGS